MNLKFNSDAFDKYLFLTNSYETQYQMKFAIFNKTVIDSYVKGSGSVDVEAL